MALSDVALMESPGGTKRFNTAGMEDKDGCSHLLISMSSLISRQIDSSLSGSSNSPSVDANDDCLACKQSEGAESQNPSTSGNSSSERSLEHTCASKQPPIDSGADLIQRCIKSTEAKKRIKVVEKEAQPRQAVPQAHLINSKVSSRESSKMHEEINQGEKRDVKVDKHMFNVTNANASEAKLTQKAIVNPALMNICQRIEKVIKKHETSETVGSDKETQSSVIKAPSPGGALPYPHIAPYPLPMGLPSRTYPLDVPLQSKSEVLIHQASMSQSSSASPPSSSSKRHKHALSPPSSSPSTQRIDVKQDDSTCTIQRESTIHPADVSHLQRYHSNSPSVIHASGLLSRESTGTSQASMTYPSHSTFLPTQAIYGQPPIHYPPVGLGGVIRPMPTIVQGFHTGISPLLKSPLVSRPIDPRAMPPYPQNRDILTLTPEWVRTPLDKNRPSATGETTHVSTGKQNLSLDREGSYERERSVEGPRIGSQFLNKERERSPIEDPRVDKPHLSKDQERYSIDGLMIDRSHLTAERQSSPIDDPRIERPLLTNDQERPLMLEPRLLSHRLLLTPSSTTYGPQQETNIKNSPGQSKMRRQASPVNPSHADTSKMPQASFKHRILDTALDLSIARNSPQSEPEQQNTAKLETAVSNDSPPVTTEIMDIVKEIETLPMESRNLINVSSHVMLPPKKKGWSAYVDFGDLPDSNVNKPTRASSTPPGGATLKRTSEEAELESDFLTKVVKPNKPSASTSSSSYRSVSANSSDSDERSTGSSIEEKHDSVTLDSIPEQIPIEKSSGVQWATPDQETSKLDSEVTKTFTSSIKSNSGTQKTVTPALKKSVSMDDGHCKAVDLIELIIERGFSGGRIEDSNEQSGKFGNYDHLLRRIPPSPPPFTSSLTNIFSTPTIHKPSNQNTRVQSSQSTKISGTITHFDSVKQQTVPSTSSANREAVSHNANQGKVPVEKESHISNVVKDQIWASGSDLSLSTHDKQSLSKNKHIGQSASYPSLLQHGKDEQENMESLSQKRCHSLNMIQYLKNMDIQEQPDQFTYQRLYSQFKRMKDSVGNTSPTGQSGVYSNEPDKTGSVTKQDTSGSHSSQWK
ncbi:unnamed protein product [Owenia fusiformis]|uniref:Uncharacterized protein n=1 Tax=Owenia fusiformis TaxID=6347 RepID=A0A8J1TN86_OWEFU|nr:unnamed protein product [Owenia fusiformis]